MSSVHWSGIAGYIKYAPNDKWAFATRGEYFSDNGGTQTGTPQKLSEFTLTLQRMLASKIMTRLEFRRDMSDQNVFPDHASGLKDSQNTVTLGHGVRIHQCGCQVVDRGAGAVKNEDRFLTRRQRCRCHVG